MKYLTFLLFLCLNRIQAGPVQSVLHDDTNAPLLMAYYPDWYAESFPPEKVNFGKFDWIDFAFAIPNSQFGLSWDDPETAPDLLARLVSVAHLHGKKVKLSIGGWTGSKLVLDHVAKIPFHLTRGTLGISRPSSPLLLVDSSLLMK
jgi:GH18 family chitinase